MKYIRIKKQGLPWQSSDQDIILPVQGVWAPPLVGELTSHVCLATKPVPHTPELHSEDPACPN